MTSSSHASNGFDVIGDIHGQAGKLHALLRTMGYTERASGWVPPQGRQAVFVGDLIDRGPEQVAVLETVRGLIDQGHGHAVMGNHEFNAIARNGPLVAYRWNGEVDLDPASLVASPS